MKKRFVTAALMISIALAFGLGGCLLEDREIEIVLNDEHCEEFVEYHTTENYTTPAIIELGEDLDSLLVDNDITRDQIVDVLLVSGAYKVDEFSHTHDWEISGIITVERLDVTGVGPDTLVAYDEISLEDELGIKTTVSLHPDGVAIVNAAMDDYITGGNPRLQLTVINGDVYPTPSSGDPLDFIWKACLSVQVIATLEVEVVNWLGGS